MITASVPLEMPSHLLLRSEDVRIVCSCATTRPPAGTVPGTYLRVRRLTVIDPSQSVSDPGTYLASAIPAFSFAARLQCHTDITLIEGRNVNVNDARMCLPSSEYQY